MRLAAGGWNHCTRIEFDLNQSSVHKYLVTWRQANAPHLLDRHEPLDHAHQVWEFNFDLEFLDEELKPIDILYVWDIVFNTDVLVHKGLTIFGHFKVMVVALCRCRALGLQNYWEEWINLPMIVDLEAIELGVVDELLLVLLDDRAPPIKH